MAREGARRSAVLLVEDEQYQRRHERVAGIDVAKASAVVCTRLPPASAGGRRASRIESVQATVPAISALGERLLADGVEMVTLESTSVIWGFQDQQSRSHRQGCRVRVRRGKVKSGSDEG